MNELVPRMLIRTIERMICLLVVEIIQHGVFFDGLVKQVSYFLFIMN